MVADWADVGGLRRADVLDWAAACLSREPNDWDSSADTTAPSPFLKSSSSMLSDPSCRPLMSTVSGESCCRYQALVTDAFLSSSFLFRHAVRLG